MKSISTMDNLLRYQEFLRQQFQISEKECEMVTEYFRPETFLNRILLAVNWPSSLRV